jgi:hypothetical protein
MAPILFSHVDQSGQLTTNCVAALLLDRTDPAPYYLLHFQVYKVRHCAQDQLAAHFRRHLQRATRGKFILIPDGSLATSTHAPKLQEQNADDVWQTGINYSSWYIVNLVFNKIIFGRFRAWWYVQLSPHSPRPASALLG